MRKLGWSDLLTSALRLASASAVVAMRNALDAFEVTGIETNIEFHRFVMRHPDYVAGRVSTRWLETTLLPAYQGT